MQPPDREDVAAGVDELGPSQDAMNAALKARAAHGPQI
jgi:hypothetical protein